MTLPIAVSPGTLGPGLYLTVDLLAGAGTPGQAPLKVLMLGPVMATDTYNVGGDLDFTNLELRSGGGPDSAAEAFGLGGASHLAAKRLYAKAPGASVDFLGYQVSGGTYATHIVYFAGTPASAQVVDMNICGRTWSVSWDAGMTATDLVTKLAKSIMDRTDDLPCVAYPDTNTAHLVIRSKDRGTLGLDITGYCRLHSAQNGTEAITNVASTPVAGFFNLGTGGTGTPSPTLATILSQVDTKEYAFILPVLSNTDVTDTGIVSAVPLHIEGHNTGLNAKLEQFVVGATWDIASAKFGAADSTCCRNSTFGELILCINGQSLPCEFAAREVGGWVSTLPIDPAVNRIGELFDGVYGSMTKLTDTPTQSQIEDALGNGVALVSYTAQGLEVLVRPVVTHSQDSIGNPDRRLLDAQMVSATYIVARDMRSALPAEFPGAKVTPDLAPGNDPPPKNVVEERDIKAFVISRLRFWQNEGVITKASLDASIADESLSVKVNSSDASQVDIVLPFKIVPPLAKFGVVVQRQPS